ncbi:MAG: hypothetical protein P9F75_00745 [Candidatus Contendobacter sp.]|nr:hypothetical protein [Candidatus Contendobacter sp.]
MNKISLIFTALRAYKQARGQEATTLRGIIAGTLAAGAITGLWWMGAELSADQISLVMGAVYGVDTVLKIVMPDQLKRGTHEHQDLNHDISGDDPDGTDPDRGGADNRMQRMPADGRPREDSSDGPESQSDGAEFGRDGSA